LPNWEARISKILEAVRAHSIKRRMVIFAVVATLVPSFVTAVLSYFQNKRALTQKIAEALHGSSSQAAREIDLWLKERLYDVRVFASSYEVSENLDRIRAGAGSQPVNRLRDYLSSVKDRFTDYQELIVADRNGHPIASSAGRDLLSTPPRLRADWVEQTRTRGAIIGEAYWDTVATKPVMTLGVPITATDGRFLGALAAKLALSSVVATLKGFAPEPSGALQLATTRGYLVASSDGVDQTLMTKKLPDLGRLLAADEGSVEYANHAGRDVVGALTRIPRLEWTVVAEIPRAEAYAQVNRLLWNTVETVFGLLVGIGAVAYLLSLTIVLPLERLARGAREVATGDLSVAVPVVGGGEAAYVTEVFNDMVTRLRQGRDELEKLSRTDGLTGLPNRRHLMESIEKEIRRGKRNARPFTLLMIDVDHFKHYNDTFGHLAGDQVLKALAGVLSGAIRTVDYSARFGGEEFTVLLPETPVDGALEVAERIRSRTAEQVFEGHSHVTLSIGIAECPSDGETPEAVIGRADAMLYQAKQRGRNRIITTRMKLEPLRTSSGHAEPPPRPPSAPGAQGELAETRKTPAVAEADPDPTSDEVRLPTNPKTESGRTSTSRRRKPR
jgi:diguanylate cyclase (GGDEF)-like protein